MHERNITFLRNSPKIFLGSTQVHDKLAIFMLESEITFFSPRQAQLLMRAGHLNFSANNPARELTHRSRL